MNVVLFIGCLLGFVSVGFGAYAEHGLKKRITEEVYRNVIVSVRYNQIYAAVISGLGLILFTDLSVGVAMAITWAAGIFTLACVLFCFSIYLFAVLDNPKLARLAPFGGISFMIGWLVLASAAFL